MSVSFDLSSTAENYIDEYQTSVNKYELFWKTAALQRLKWDKEFDQVLESDESKGEFKWFGGGKLNVSVNCLDRHVEKHPDKAALIWEKNEPEESTHIVTYRELLAMTCRVANVLKKYGVKKKDCVAIYMPVCPQLVAAMLACARIGAIHCVLFGGFNGIALKKRIEAGPCKVIFTVDKGYCGKEDMNYMQEVFVARKQCDFNIQVFVAKRAETELNAEVNKRDKGDYWLEDEMKLVSDVCPPVELDSEDELFILYTSGSTGEPKGIIHTQAGYLLYASLTQQYVFDYNPELESEVFACVADIGWITGHSYVVYGPLCNGGTTVLFEGLPTYPNPGRYWQMVEKLKVTHFYTALMSVRKLLRHGDKWVTRYNRTSLKVLGCVGEPLDATTWTWYHDVVGNGQAVVVDTYWQTETGGIVMAPRPSPVNEQPLPGYPMRPFWGILPDLYEKPKKNLYGNDLSGHLCITRPWPGQAKGMWSNREQCMKSYYQPFQDVYYTGDVAYRDEHGYYRITGRADDIIVIAGENFGTAEIESYMIEDPRVTEAAVVMDSQNVLVAFVTLKEGVCDDLKSIVADLREKFKTKFEQMKWPCFKSKILVVDELPMTRSGKIMRRFLKKIVENEADEDQLGDVSTFANPDVIKKIEKIIDKFNNAESIVCSQ